MALFSTTIIEDFYDNPDDIRDYALNSGLAYEPSTDGRWPGVRAKITNNRIYQMVGMHYLLNHYDTIELANSVAWQAAAFFQICSKKDGHGWIHIDYPFYHVAMTFLTPNAPLSSGTSLYRPKKSLFGCKNYDPIRVKFHLGQMSMEEVEPYRKLHNEPFEEIATLHNVYNRCVGYDGNVWHSANSYDTDENERLTLIVFFKSVSGPMAGINRVRTKPMDGMRFLDINPSTGKLFDVE